MKEKETKNSTEVNLLPIVAVLLVVGIGVSTIIVFGMGHTEISGLVVTPLNDGHLEIKVYGQGVVRFEVTEYIMIHPIQHNSNTVVGFYVNLETGGYGDLRWFKGEMSFTVRPNNPLGYVTVYIYGLQDNLVWPQYTYHGG